MVEFMTKEYEAIRNSVKLILLNRNNELLLMRTDDEEIKNKDGSFNGCFWQMVGGGIEEGETLQEAAYRELYEETGLKKEDVVLEDIAWYGEVDLFMYGVKTRIKQSFVPARTKKLSVSLENLPKKNQL